MKDIALKMANKKPVTIRKKKVYKSYRVSHAGLYRRKYRLTSKIILEGNYLLEAGFMPDQEITIKLEAGKIVITGN